MSDTGTTPMGTTATVATQDGRNLIYLEVGDPHGPLVIHNHGGPSSRLEALLFASSASKNRLRLICVDRPGIGRPSPQDARTYSGWRPRYQNPTERWWPTSPAAHICLRLADVGLFAATTNRRVRQSFKAGITDPSRLKSARALGTPSLPLILQKGQR
jgi:pimeloyl-ACP methyl ester carboxylesterase